MALLSNQQLETLRANWSRIQGIDPASTTYQTLIGKLNKYSPEVLQQLAGANIKFLSALARNRTKTKTEDTSPSSVHSDIIEQLKSEIQQVSTVTDEQSYKRAVRQLLVRKPVIPAAQVEQFVRRFMQAYPYSQYRIAKKTGDMRTSGVTESAQNVVFTGTGANGVKYQIIKTDSGEFMIHADGKHIDTYGSQQRAMGVLQNEVPGLKRTVESATVGSVTEVKADDKLHKVTWMSNSANKVEYFDSAAKAQAKVKQLTSLGQYHHIKHTPPKTSVDEDAIKKANESTVREADDAEDIDQDVDAGTDGDEENPRDIETEVPSELDLDWISKFDLGEIKEAIQKIIDHLSNTEDEEQIELLRNDIRILDNLHGALGKKDSAAVDKYWKIAKDEGSHEHLHPEFAKRMDDATALVNVKESYVAEEVTFKSKAKWDKAAKKFRVKATGKSETAFCKDTGAMMGRWAGEKGWLESC